MQTTKQKTVADFKADIRKYYNEIRYCRQDMSDGFTTKEEYDEAYSQNVALIDGAREAIEIMTA